MKKNIFSLLFLILCCISSHAQHTAGLVPKEIKKGLRFYLIDDEAGLSNNTINSMVQDKQGFIWIGTMDGLNRYDGSSFVKYKMDGRSPSLLYNYIQHLAVDEKGDILISTDGGLNVFDVSKEAFRAYTTENGLLQNYVNTAIPMPDGSIILGIYKGGIQLLQPNGSLKQLNGSVREQKDLSSIEISCMALQGDSILWVGTYNGGLNKFRLKDKKADHITFSYKEAASTINHLYLDQEGNTWVGTMSGLYVITVSADTIFTGASHNRGKGLSDAEVLCLQEDDRGNIWIGTRNGGLNIVNKQEFLTKKGQAQFEWFLPRDDGESVYNRTVSSILKDRNGNMWLGTSTGINFVDPKGEKLMLLRRKPTSSGETLAHNRIGALEHDANGDLWIGTDGGGLNLVEAASGSIRHFQHSPTDPASLSNDYVLALKKDSRGYLWVGTYRGGLSRMDPETGKCRHYLQGPVSSGSDVRTIVEDSRNRLWVGTNRGGLYRYDEHADKFLPIEKTGALDIRDIEEAPNGGLWLATYGDGIGFYLPEADSIRFFNTSNTAGLSSNIVFSLVQTLNGEIWAGTQYGGLIKFNPSTGSVQVYSEQHGLANNTVSSLLLENEQHLWIGTLSGISHLHIPTEKISSLAYPANNSAGELNHNAVSRGAGGYIYFGGNKGISLFHPQEVRAAQPAPPLMLTALKLFNKLVPVNHDDEQAVLRQSLSHQKVVVLPYDQSLISIDFAALQYPFSDNVSYSYTLENYNSHWIEAGNVGTANFSNLPPGRYLFRAKAQHSSDAENASYATLSIIITPPFWKTLPAYVIYTLLLILLFYGAMKYYTERVKLQNSLLLEKKQRQLEHDLNEERSRFFTSFSHELKTPLTLILAPIEDLAAKAKSREDKTSLGLVQKNARYLLQLINKLLDFRKTEVGLNELKLAQYRLKPIVENWFNNYKPLTYKKKINFCYQAPEEEVVAWVDLEKLQIMVYNLLTNAIKFTPKNGTIELKLFADHTHVYIQVQDTGEGISPDALPHIFEWYYRAGDTNKKGTGIGLALSQRLAALHHGNILAESRPKEGSSFTISLPLDHELPPHLQQELEAVLSPQEDTQLIPLLPGEELAGPQEECEEKIIHTGDGNREVLLLIDDNPGILQYLSGLLKNDYHLITAQDGVQGLEKACQYVPDLIISDICMPGKNGLELCKCLKQNAATTHIPVILLTVNDSDESIKEGFEEGADHYITKPFNGQLLLTRIKSLLSKRRQLREYFQNKTGETVSAEEENSPLFRREKQFLEALESTILSQIQADEANVEAIAHSMAMSRTSLYRKIKAVTGQNINEYIRTVKLKRAAQLMNEQGLNVSQAAHEVGFSSMKYFRKLFKDQFGKLPSDLTKE
ncbi:two-component regulator propeller domain-containing protein [Cesiribacter sp. SM1]|uniref:hybrid sensor histidine kinase/response regulator transcription factor n=1 Tax=Cesiribacter sp. SM1 TaxID=2861196 RepID=UPI001CD688FE|nr:two-component regulator propeller domain-containing protein [Cesiribacter sp. SM1]